jgi:hypothetical protein
MTGQLTARATGSYHAAVLSALPWLVAWRPAWLPAAIVAAALAWRPAARAARLVDPWAATVMVGSSIVALMTSGWRTALMWTAAAAVVAGVALIIPGLRRPDAADVSAMVVWGAAFVVRPDALTADGGGWCAPAVLLYGAVRLGRWKPIGSFRAGERPLGPPTREVRGTLSLRGVVVAGHDGLPRTVPLDLEVRAGETFAIRCDSDMEGEAFADAVSGRRAPVQGEVTVDGVPVGHDERVVVRVGRGEPFLPGDLESNLAALCDGPLDRRASASIREACGLNEVEHALAGAELAVTGEPLTVFHRLLVQAGRLVPSHYRVAVVLDPRPWVNAVRAEVWRTALVRAAVGRTTLWITTDVELASRATRVFELRGGGLRPVEAPVREA